MVSMIDYLLSIFYGVLEGITEWLPISSTGHLLILERFLPMNVRPEFMSIYRIVIQLGAIFAVIVLYWSKLWPFPLKRTQAGQLRLSFDRGIFLMWLKIVLACIPAAVVGLLFDAWIEEHFYNIYCVALMLALFALFFLLVERKQRQRPVRIQTMDEISWRDAFIIGLYQLVAAVFPGVSRSGATILGGLQLGISRPLAAEFTFFLAVPVMLGASLLKLLKLRYLPMEGELLILALGMLSAFFVSLLVIRFLMAYIRKHNFNVFAIYRILLAVILLGSLFI